MNTKKIYRVKVIGTYIIIGVLILFFTIFTIVDYRAYISLNNDYNKVFLEVTENFEGSNTYDLIKPTGTITQTQMKSLLEEFGLYNQSYTLKVKELSNILLTMDDKAVINRRRRASYNKLVNTQSCLESLALLADKYLKTNSDYNLQDDEDTLLKGYLQISIMRDLIKGR
jgi:hypothetical protein